MLIHNIVIDGRNHRNITPASDKRLDAYRAKYRSYTNKIENQCVDVSEYDGFGQGLVNYYNGHKFLWYDTLRRA